MSGVNMNGFNDIMEAMKEMEKLKDLAKNDIVKKLLGKNMSKMMNMMNEETR